ncbi:MAG: hypothetical protein R2815_12885 [Flavobacteriales bacterium]
MTFPQLPRRIRTDTVDLLDEWFKESWAHSSEFAPRRLYTRAIVNSIHTILKGFYPNGRIIHKFGQDQSLADVGIVKRLLMRPLHRVSVFALSEIANLITFCKLEQTSLYENLQHQIRNPRQFQASLFEAFIARQLKTIGLDYVCEAVVNGKPRDGYFPYLNEKWVVECKQQFAPAVDEFDIMRRVIDQVIMQLNRHKIVGGGGLVFRLARPANAKAISSATRLLNEVFLKISDGDVPVDRASQWSESQMTIEVLPLGVLDPGYRTTDTELVARIEINPANQSAAIALTVPISIQFDFGYSRETVIKKLRTIIQDAREQHRDLGTEKLLICIDSQELPDLQLGLLQGSNLLDDEVVRQRVSSVVEDAVVFVIQRQYLTAGLRYQAYALYDPQHKSFAQHVIQSFPNPAGNGRLELLS